MLVDIVVIVVIVVVDLVIVVVSLGEEGQGNKLIATTYMDLVCFLYYCTKNFIVYRAGPG